MKSVHEAARVVTQRNEPEGVMLMEEISSPS